jgi:glyoxylase-like metal-dependent hydrolase (beta-lactamase superfamily II)
MLSNLLLSRRSLLGGAVAATAASPLLNVSIGQTAEPDAKALRAIHRFGIGAMRITVIDDARFTFPAPAFAANQPEGTIGPFLDRFGLPTDFASLHMQVTLIENGDNKVLLDTGMGDVTFPKNPVDNGRLAAGLSAIGVAPEDITAVILSHGHPDHIGSCSKNGEPVFKNATYFMPPGELEFWTQNPGAEQTFPNFMLGVGNAQLEPIRKLIKPYGDGDEIVPGVTAVAAPGHTLGHHAFLLHEGDGKLLHLMDTAVHYLVGPEEPDWALAVEMDQKAAAATRRRLFKQAAEEKLLVAGYHFPFPGIGRIVEHGPAWRFVPMQTA